MNEFRLDHKLTQRRPAPPTEPPPESSSSGDEEAGGVNQHFPVINKKKKKEGFLKNQNKHLIHTGYWLPQVRDSFTGQVLENTGLWNCCGNIDNLSIYCINSFTNVRFISKIYTQHNNIDENKVNNDNNNNNEQLNGANAREAFNKKIELENEENEIIEKHKEMKIKLKEQLFSSQDNLVDKIIAKEMSVEEKAMMNACSSDDSMLNTPMLVMWLLKNIEHEPVMMRGLALLLKHLQTGEGCLMISRHGGFQVIEKAHEYYSKHPPIQLLCISTLRKLLDCNFTRDSLIDNNVKVVHMAFSIAHSHMNSRFHVEEATRCIAQCSRHETCRHEIFQTGIIIPHLIQFCKKYSHVSPPVILRYALKVFGWISTTHERIQCLYEIQAVKAAYHCIKRHPKDQDVLAPGIMYLCRSAASHPPVMQYLLHVQAVRVIILGLQALHSNERIQLEGMKMLRNFAKTQEGWYQITATRGGWQNITQGTSHGSTLIHDLKGDLNNPGWCIGERPHLTEGDRNKLTESTVRLGKGGARRSPSSGVGVPTWTAVSLKAFMGITAKDQQLAINNEGHEVYFALLTTLGLLPLAGEDRVDWFTRLHVYEQEGGIGLQEMVATSLELEKRQKALDKTLSMEKAEGLGETVKAVYVGGQRITTKYLSENDRSAQETLDSVINA